MDRSEIVASLASVKAEGKVLASLAGADEILNWIDWDVGSHEAGSGRTG